MPRLLPLVLCVCLLAVAGVAAAQAAPAKTVLHLQTASGAQMKFTSSSLKAKAGVVVIMLQNASLVPHNVAIKGNGVNVKGKVVPHGSVSTVTATLKKGRYEFYCSVPGHEQAGMKGTLTIS